MKLWMISGIEPWNIKFPNIPIIPIALNSGLFWQKGLKVIKRGHIIIEFLPQINIGLDKKEVLNKVENSIESATNKLLN